MPPSSAPAKRTLATRTIEAWFRKRLPLQAAGAVAREPIVAFRSAKEPSASVAFRSAKGRSFAERKRQCRLSLRERAFFRGAKDTSPVSPFAPRKGVSFADFRSAKESSFAERKTTMSRRAGLQSPAVGPPSA